MAQTLDADYVVLGGGLAGLRDDIGRSSRVELRLGARAEAVSTVSCGVQVKTSAGTLLTRQVIDTRLQPTAAML